MAVSPSSRTLRREIYMDFVDIPFYIEFTTVALRKPDPDANTVGMFLRPFKFEVWISILAAIPLAGVAVVLNTRAYGGIVLTTQKRTCLRNSFDALWFSCGALLQQGENCSLSRITDVLYILFAELLVFLQALCTLDRLPVLRTGGTAFVHGLN